MIEQLAPLHGLWVGTGKGRYPTIPSFEFSEALRFRLDRDRSLVHYDQQTLERIDGAPAFTPSHWESGFLRVVEPDLVELTNAQTGGRLEILRLRVTTSGDTLVLEGGSVAIYNDPRLASSHRRFELSGDVLRYRVMMATTRVHALTQHLEAELRRDRASLEQP